MMKRSHVVTLLGIVVLGALAVLMAFALLRALVSHQQETRGVAFGTLPSSLPWRTSGSPYGINVSLHNDQTNLERSLDLVQDAGFLWLRQRFPWAEIEPERGVFRWEVYDRIVEAATSRHLKLIAVLDTSPIWARHAQVETAPPDNMEDYGNFVAAFVSRYRGRVDHIQIWDEPNITPHWGDWWVSPEEYVTMLKVAYTRAKTVHPHVVVLGGGLAPTVADDRFNLNDVTFLQRMYAKDARGYFDVLAAKPYGFWSDPNDRRVDFRILNFSRLILLREIMIRNGDGARPIWAVEMGWNALPAGWTGRPAPWGTDSDIVQARRTVEALHRAQAEWPWLDVLVLNGLRFPGAAHDDPIHGFALVDESLTPRPVYQAVQTLVRSPLVANVGRHTANTHAAIYSSEWTPVAGDEAVPFSYRTDHAGAEVVLHWRGTGLAVYVNHGPGAGRLRVWLDGNLLTRFPNSRLTNDILDLTDPTEHGMTKVVLASGLPDVEHTVRLQTVNGDEVRIGGYEVVRSVSFAWFYSQMVLLATGVLGCVMGISILMPRLPWARWIALADCLPLSGQLAVLAFLIAVFYITPWLPLASLTALLFVTLAVIRLDLALALTVVTFPFYLYPKHVGTQAFSLSEILILLCLGAYLIRGLGTRCWFWDGAFRLPVVFFFGVALVSLWASTDLRLSLRELRTVIIEPVIFYILAVAAFGRGGCSLPRSALLWALLAAGVAAAGQAMFQYFVTGQVITAEGVRRALGPYGSPNNLGLLLERVLPLSLALLLHNREKLHAPRSALYFILIGCCLLLAITIFLTYSVGAWLGTISGLLIFTALRGRRQVAILLAGLALITVVLLPFLHVERVVSHLRIQGETTASIRLDLWQSSLEMLRDHPLKGVGLDGFLEQYRSRYIRPTALREANLSHPHNMLLEWWLFLGILGVPALLWFLIAFYRRTWHALAPKHNTHRTLVQGVMAAMTAAVAHGLVDRFYFGSPDLAFTFFALLAASEVKQASEDRRA